MSYCVRRQLKVLFKQRKYGLEAAGNLSLMKSGLWQASKSKLSMSTHADHSVHEEQSPRHIPVMTKEVLEILETRKGQIVVDMTFGGGGHSRAILQQAPDVTLIASDRDPQVYPLSQALALERTGHSKVLPVLGKFSELHQHLRSHGIGEGMVDGFIFDLGASSMQFDSPHRGFAISADGPLDMRMDGNRFPEAPTAADLVNHLDPGDLSVVLKGYGEERLARSIAQAIVEARYAFGNITRTRQLAQIVDMVFEGNHKKDKLQRHAHPATKVFQALRIFVNDELNELNNGLELAWRFLRPGGRCVVISFHSLEDRIVKRHFHGIDMDLQGNMTVKDYHRNSAVFHPIQQVERMLEKRWRPVSKKVMLPSDEEVLLNPRSRSAKLRAAVKL